MSPSVLGAWQSRSLLLYSPSMDDSRLYPWMEAGLSEYFRDGTIREVNMLKRYPWKKRSYSLELRSGVYDLKIEAFCPSGMIVSMLCTLVTKISTKPRSEGIRNSEFSVNFLAFPIPSIFFGPQLHSE
jgi:hypothetical protein